MAIPKLLHKRLISFSTLSGDTRFSIYTGPAHPDLLRVKLLICEATYLEDTPRMAENAERYGHVWWSLFARRFFVRLVVFFP